MRFLKNDPSKENAYVQKVEQKPFFDLKVLVEKMLHILIVISIFCKLKQVQLFVAV